LDSRSPWFIRRILLCLVRPAFSWASNAQKASNSLICDKPGSRTWGILALGKSTLRICPRTLRTPSTMVWTFATPDAQKASETTARFVSTVCARDHFAFWGDAAGSCLLEKYRHVDLVGHLVTIGLVGARHPRCSPLPSPRGLRSNSPSPQFWAQFPEMRIVDNTPLFWFHVLTSKSIIGLRRTTRNYSWQLTSTD
jgi:hypothetical protein